ncbi:E3 ubiquitin-protein ligase SDIR1 [Gracilariopsis chorda]|uniref:RING-type E3 ubiquitin transferase n=1 Tax=Gracilariopsis chorda TaxID=448386 RepID=A0A2V3J2W0_9FLOR|nr:E3 ubiquitin-protein ligase SDIR1 [Gracilariopsis chorda]|eukprot:PXF48714.1 E3 ubiquitin-protein ligase SDIR1 [Gracilariopsis chorda]
MADSSADSPALGGASSPDRHNSNLRRRLAAVVTPSSHHPTTSNNHVAHSQDTTSHPSQVHPPQSLPPPPRALNNNFNVRAMAGAMGLGLITAAVGGTYLLSDNDTVFPFAVAACVATFSSVILRLALSGIVGNSQHARARVRHFRPHRHFTGERAAYVRISQRLALMDRDFTDADYELLLDLDNNSQRLRRFLEGASEEAVARLPTFIYQDPEKLRQHKEKALECSDEPETVDEEEPVEQEITDKHVAEVVQPTEEHEGEQLKNPLPQTSELADVTAKHCIICLEDFEHGMKIRTLPCFHRFMAECIDPWLQQQAKCPVCKESIDQGLHTLPPGFT